LSIIYRRLKALHERYYAVYESELVWVALYWEPDEKFIGRNISVYTSGPTQHASNEADAKGFNEKDQKSR
jgi:hypothetical protein